MRSIRMTVLAASLAAPMLAVAATGTVPATGAAMDAKAMNKKGYVVRDWSKMDTNKDHLISPEEMTAYIDAHPGPLATKRTAAQAGPTLSTAPRWATVTPEASIMTR